MIEMRVDSHNFQSIYARGIPASEADIPVSYERALSFRHEL